MKRVVVRIDERPAGPLNAGIDAHELDEQVCARRRRPVRVVAARVPVWVCPLCTPGYLRLQQRIAGRRAVVDIYRLCCAVECAARRVQ